MPEPTKYVEWYINKCVFEFEDSANYEKWKAEPKIFFEFLPSEATDKGAAVLGGPSGETIIFEVTQDVASVAIYEDDDGPCITMSIFFPLDGDTYGKHIPFRKDLDNATLRNWHENLEGHYSGHIGLGFDDANLVQDDYRGWKVTTSEDLELYAGAVDDEGFAKLEKYLRRTKTP